MHTNDDYNLQNNVFIIAPLFSWMSHACMCELHNNYKGTPLSSDSDGIVHLQSKM